MSSADLNRVLTRLERIDARLRVIERSTARVETHANWVQELYSSLYQRPLMMVVAACRGEGLTADAMLDV